jgi:uncharacterized hydrophobic protein (TIGR00271 family)
MAPGRTLTRLGRWLRMEPDAKPQVYAQVYGTADMASVNYWAELVLSAGIATFGLVLNSPAVIIGAMLISPLMGPIMATGLALSAGDLYLAVKAVVNLATSIAVAILLSGVMVWLLPFHSATNEILARINPNLLDLGVALFSGLAGSIAVARSNGNQAISTLPGVAIAVALMPPLCTIGFGLGSGANMRIMGGAGLLFLTNLVAIVASAFLVFLLVGMNSPEIRVQMEAVRSRERFAGRLAGGPLGRILASGSQLHWRGLMLIVLLAAVAVPLRRALQQVAGEAVARTAVQQAIQNLIPRGALVSQQVEVGRDSIAVQLVATQRIPKRKIEAAEQSIEQRSGRKADLSIASVASQSELAELMQRVSTVPSHAQAPPAPPNLDEIRKELTGRVQPVLAGLWPAEAPLQGFALALGPAGIVLDAQYKAPKALDPVALAILQQQLQTQLSAPTLTLNATRATPAKLSRQRVGR